MQGERAFMDEKKLRFQDFFAVLVERSITPFVAEHFIGQLQQSARQSSRLTGRARLDK